MCDSKHQTLDAVDGLIPLRRVSHSVAETESIARELAKSLLPGDCIALHGDLGAGKTQFVRGLVDGLGANHRTVSSPTYVLLNVYRGGRLEVFHLDAYRTAGESDFEGIGFAELLEQGGVVVVEWAERIPALLPPRRLQVTLTTVGRDRREIVVERLG